MPSTTLCGLVGPFKTLLGLGIFADRLVLGPIKGHDNHVNCILWSLDGSQLFSASDDRTIRCWNSETGKSMGKPWTGHTREVASLSLSPKGTKLASGSLDNTVRFWVACSGDPIGHPLQHEIDQFGVAFSPSGDFVASGGKDLKISIWRVPWSDETQTQDHSLLDPPAVPVPEDQYQLEGKSNFPNLPTTHLPIASSSRPPADATAAPIATRVQHLPDSAWNLNDIRSNFAHDLTGHVEREGEDPFASGSFGDIYKGKLRLRGKSINVAVKAIRTYGFANDDDVAQTNKIIDTASGLQYLHSKSIVHGDLSGVRGVSICVDLTHTYMSNIQSNVLVDANGRACISDFGLSTLLTELGGSTYATSSHTQGTLRWTAPELLDTQVPDDEDNLPDVFPTPQSDVYSFGRIMLQVLTGKIPFHYYPREPQVLSAISRAMIPKRPSRTLVTDRQWTFMQRCWMLVDGDESRPGDDEIVEFSRQELAEIAKTAL
ncbi:WD40 repeat-like protein [Paxillus ammoniavirescens]|nr:WD40 repeat-like protein [Paxillus ammoniavirescens]